MLANVWPPFLAQVTLQWATSMWSILLQYLAISLFAHVVPGWSWRILTRRPKLMDEYSTRSPADLLSSKQQCVVILDGLKPHLAKRWCALMKHLSLNNITLSFESAYRWWEGVGVGKHLVEWLWSQWCAFLGWQVSFFWGGDSFHL